jgi:hypothetical protein
MDTISYLLDNIKNFSDTIKFINGKFPDTKIEFKKLVYYIKDEYNIKNYLIKNSLVNSNYLKYEFRESYTYGCYIIFYYELEYMGDIIKIFSDPEEIKLCSIESEVGVTYFSNLCDQKTLEVLNYDSQFKEHNFHINNELHREITGYVMKYVDMEFIRHPDYKIKISNEKIKKLLPFA